MRKETIFEAIINEKKQKSNCFTEFNYSDNIKIGFVVTNGNISTLYLTVKTDNNITEGRFIAGESLSTEQLKTFINKFENYVLMTFHICCTYYLPKEDNLPDALYRYIKERNIKQVNLAKLLGVSTGEISQCIQGKFKFNTKLIKGLVNILGFDANYVICKLNT